MNRWHNHYPDNHAHFCTAAVQDFRPLLKDEAIHVLYDEWNKARLALAVKVLAYCIMPDHIHIVLWAERGESVKKFLHRTLAQTSRRLQPGGGFWKERPHTIPIYSAKVLREKVDYLHRNPLRKNLAENPEDWRHSSYGQLVIGDCAPAFVCDDWGSYIT